MAVSRKIAQSFFPIAEANWSIMPQFIPLYLFSEYCPILAHSTIEISMSNKSRTITHANSSIDAEAERPLPAGRSAFITMS